MKSTLDKMIEKKNLLEEGVKKMEARLRGLPALQQRELRVYIAQNKQTIEKLETAINDCGKNFNK